MKPDPNVVEANYLSIAWDSKASPEARGAIKIEGATSQRRVMLAKAGKPKEAVQ